MSMRSPNVLIALYMVEPFGSEVHEGIQEYLAENAISWRIHLCDSRRGYRSGVRWMTHQRRLDGVITDYHDDAEMRVLRRAGVPVVWLGPDRDEPVNWVRGYPERFALVQLDVAEVVRAALDHFLSRAGFRSFGFVESPWDFGWSKPRGNAWERECARRNLPHSRFLHWNRFAPLRPPEGPDYDGLTAWIRALEKPAAILCASDETAVDVLGICEDEGVAVPRNAAVLGMDDRPFIWQHTHPALSSLHFDKVRAGRLCALALDTLLRGGDPPPVAHYGVGEVMQRASTGMVSTAGNLVQRALDFIDANSSRRIGIDDVARHVGVSRALATLRFRQLQGETIHDAIRRVRVGRARRMLSSRGASESAIAEACGFGSVDSMRRAFVAVAGAVPSALRR